MALKGCSGHLGRERILPGLRVTSLPGSTKTSVTFHRTEKPPCAKVPIDADGQCLASRGETSRFAHRDSSRRAANGHRHCRSEEEKPTLAGDLAGYQLSGSHGRPSRGRDDFSDGLKPYKDSHLHSTTVSSSTKLGEGSSISTPNVQGAIYREHGHNSAGGAPNKQTLLGRIKRHLLPGSHKPHDKSKRDHSPKSTPARKALKEALFRA